MMLCQLAKELNISRRNLKYYVARYANDLNWSANDQDDLARIVLFRKLGFSARWIRMLREGECGIQEAFDSCPKAGKRIAASDLEWLQGQQWGTISFEDCVVRINANALSTPKQDVIFWGRLLEDKVIAAALGIMLAGILFVLQHRWRDCLLTVARCLLLVLIYVSTYAVIDEVVWKKRSRRAKW